MGVSLHPTALVDPRAELGVEVEVGAYSVIGPQVKIGDRTCIGPHVVLDGNTILGPENKIFQFASIGAPPQDLKYKGEPTKLIIGCRNVFRECVTVHRGTVTGHGQTIIGDNNLLMANSHVAHDCVVGDGNVFANSVALAGHVTLHNRIILGGLAGVHQFVTIGDFALLGAGSMVGLDVPPYCIVQGDRAHLRGINVIGLKRAGFTSEDISSIRAAYRHFFSTLGHLAEKIASLDTELKQRPVVEKMITFIQASQRGVSTAKGNLQSDDE